MRVETTYIPSPECPDQWQRKVARLLGQGVIAHLRAGERVGAPSTRLGKASQVGSEEERDAWDKGRVVRPELDGEG